MQPIESAHDKHLLNALNAGMRALVRRTGLSDHGEIVWATFSDDDGATRIRYATHRDHLTPVVSQLDECVFKSELARMRNAGEKLICWGVDQVRD
jgi:hypothetical protein